MPRLLFEKTGNAVWISHLDLMRVFQRAFRRGGILIRHSQGFTPRAHVSIALAGWTEAPEFDAPGRSTDPGV